ncbi:hypothetical protein FH972_016422 [Carpinus fangiana]|uniref:Gnk2-homologous domain-containing protein n=1 Tax=Carpinus fangiana TaxID=176857 RepID=A0A5N6RH36_9ROSI|nr:hypothetical protein FH972_016422 [Carpinus fangiana]
MPSYNVSMILVILSLLSFLSLTSAQVPNYRYHFCSNESTFTPKSTYQLNLSQLLSYLSSNATRESGFYNATAGQSPATTIYGLFLCRADLTTNACRDCVATATTEIAQQYCLEGKVALIWYDECMLRYSNRSFFSTMEEEPRKFLWNVRDITEQDRFRKLVNATLNDLVPQAANAPSGKSASIKMIAIAIVAAIAVSLVLCAMIYYLLRQRARKKYNALPAENVPHQHWLPPPNPIRVACEPLHRWLEVACGDSQWGGSQAEL